MEIQLPEFHINIDMASMELHEDILKNLNQILSDTSLQLKSKPHKEDENHWVVAEGCLLSNCLFHIIYKKNTTHTYHPICNMALN